MLYVLCEIDLHESSGVTRALLSFWIRDMVCTHESSTSGVTLVHESSGVTRALLSFWIRDMACTHESSTSAVTPLHVRINILDAF